MSAIFFDIKKLWKMIPEQGVLILLQNLVSEMLRQGGPLHLVIHGRTIDHLELANTGTKRETRSPTSTRITQMYECTEHENLDLRLNNRIVLRDAQTDMQSATEPIGLSNILHHFSCRCSKAAVAKEADRNTMFSCFRRLTHVRDGEQTRIHTTDRNASERERLRERKIKIGHVLALELLQQPNPRDLLLVQSTALTICHR